MTETISNYKKYQTYFDNYHKEYYQKNNEQIKKQKKEYYHTVRSEKIICECGKEIKIGSIINHKKSKKHISFIENITKTI